jgi:hypothetical protein
MVFCMKIIWRVASIRNGCMPNTLLVRNDSSERKIREHVTPSKGGGHLYWRWERAARGGPDPAVEESGQHAVGPTRPMEESRRCVTAWPNWRRRAGGWPDLIDGGERAARGGSTLPRRRVGGTRRQWRWAAAVASDGGWLAAEVKGGGGLWEDFVGERAGSGLGQVNYLGIFSGTRNFDDTCKKTHRT